MGFFIHGPGRAGKLCFLKNCTLYFSVPVELYTVLLEPKTLVKTLVKILVRNLAKNLVKKLVKNLSKPELAVNGKRRIQTLKGILNAYVRLTKRPHMIHIYIYIYIYYI